MQTDTQLLSEAIAPMPVAGMTAGPAIALNPRFSTGKITADRGRAGLDIEIGQETATAQVAFSCLVRPIAGDRVLLWQGPEGAFVLAIVERPEANAATLALPSGGAIAIEAQNIDLHARAAVSVDAPAFDVRSRRVTIASDVLSLLGKMATWVAEHMRVSAQTHETVADTISAKTMDRLSIVERADVLRAGNLVQTIEAVTTTTAQVAVLATKEDLRLDGKRVTVG